MAFESIASTLVNKVESTGDDCAVDCMVEDSNATPEVSVAVSQNPTRTMAAVELLGADSTPEYKVESAGELAVDCKVDDSNTSAEIPVVASQNSTRSMAAVELPGADSISPTPENKVESAGDRAVDGMVDGSEKSVQLQYCHQCRQKTAIFTACKNLRKNRLCMVKICSKCLLNRYGEKAEEVANIEGWACPKCRGICNCSICRKRKGHKPTGPLFNRAKETGFSSVSDMLLTNVDENVANPLEQEKNATYSRKRGKENSLDGPLDAHLPKSAGKKAKGVLNGEALDSITSALNQEGIKGTDLTRIAGIDVPAEDFGNVLEFLEFCSTFGEVLEIKDGEPEFVLQEIFNGPATSDVKFQIHIFRFVKPSPSYGKSSWFEAFKSLCESHDSLQPSMAISLQRAAEYDALNASEKLVVLNLLCYEVLGTEKLREWIEVPNTQLCEKAKEVRNKISEAKCKIKTLEQKIKDHTAKSIDARDGEDAAIVSHAKSEAAQAHTELLDLKAMLLKIKRTPLATPVEPIYQGCNGHVYWKLSCSSESDSDVLHQYVEKWDTLTRNEKWVALTAEEKEAIEKLPSKRRR